MAEILSTEAFDPNSNHSQMVRAETLTNNADFQWFIRKLREKEKVIVERTQSLTLSSSERDGAVHQLAGLREAINFLPSELDTLIRLVREEIQKEEPGATPRKRVL